MASDQPTSPAAEWVERVGRHIAARRIQRGYRSAKAVDLKTRGAPIHVSDVTWRQFEKGSWRSKPTANTTAAVAAILGWQPDFIDRLLAGEQPTEVDERPPPAARSVRAELDDLAQAARSLAARAEGVARKAN